MRVEFKPSFERSVKQFSPKEKEAIHKVVIQLIEILSQDKPLYQGIGLKRLKGNYWEVRKGLKARLLFRWEGVLVEFVLAGDHNEIKRFLKNV